MFLYLFMPVPAGTSFPTITFSLRPLSLSFLPLVAASVSILVVSWKDAAERNESVSRDAFVIPRSTRFDVAAFFPSSFAFLFALFISESAYKPPGIKFVSPAVITLAFDSILLTITSICLSFMSTPCCL